MDIPASFSPLSTPEDAAAALYFGHLGVASEIALPGAARETQIALCWLAGHVAHQRARLWHLTLEGIEVEGYPLGDWRLTARTTPGTRDRISLERRATLIEDGRQIIALTRPFRDGNPEDPIESLVAFSTMQLCATHAQRGMKISLRDINGTRIAIGLHRRGIISKVFSSLYSMH